jgi:hypothetical protein
MLSEAYEPHPDSRSLGGASEANDPFLSARRFAVLHWRYKDIRQCINAVGLLGFQYLAWFPKPNAVL